MLWLSYRNWVDAPTTTFAAAVEASESLAATNLAQRQIYKVWRTDGMSAGNTDASVVIDFGQVRAVQALALAWPRNNDPDLYDEVPDIASDDTVRHRLDAVTAGAGALYDSGVVATGALPGYAVHAIKLDAPVSARYWQIDLDAPSRATPGYLDLARAWAGPIVTPRIGFSYGDGAIWESDSIVAKASRGASDFVETVDSLRSWNMQLDWVDDAERNAWFEFERLMTAAGQFLAVRDDLPEGTGIMLCKQRQSAGLESASFQRSKKALRLIESI